jgi:anti-sigma regulatory factor (Ser/Thr protein kinase)
MVSELLANAIRHAPPDADGCVGLRLEQEQNVLRATVVDGGLGFSFDHATLDPGHADPHLGLFIVDTLADRWGVSPGDTNAVWFEVDR